MIEGQGWIQLHRKMREWEWYTDVNTCHLFIHLLLSANYKEQKHQGQLIKIGEVKTGRIKLSAETGLSEQQIRTSLKRLESTSEITIRKYNKYSIISIANWSDYQSKIKESTSEITSNQPATNQQLTTNNNKNNKNNENNLRTIGDFENFWSIYGKIGNKQQALKSYKRATKEGVKYETILRGLNNYQTYCRAIGQEQRYIKHASTWLNNRGWEDEYTITEQAGKQSKSKSQRAREAALRGFMS